MAEPQTGKANWKRNLWTRQPAASKQGLLDAPGEQARDGAPATTPKWVTHRPPKSDGFLPY